MIGIIAKTPARYLIDSFTGWRDAGGLTHGLMLYDAFYTWFEVY